jgi:hypothetical protein
MISRRVVLLSGPEDAEPGESIMRFRLTYEGRLRPSQPANGGPPSAKQTSLTEHKHQIRQSFHRQLERFWAVNKYLSEERVWPKDFHRQFTPSNNPPRWAVPENEKVPLKDVIAELHKNNGFRFVPLARKDFHLLCSISILFLRRQKPGKVFFSGDLDNRIKTLLDALSMPQHLNQFPGYGPQDGEDPFFVLLEDDSLISHLDVEADELLDPLDEKEDADFGKVRAVITIDLRPYHVNMRSLNYA